MLSPAEIVSPLAKKLPSDFSSILRTALSLVAAVFGIAPCWVYPSMTTGRATVGRTVVGAIVQTPVAAS